MRDDETGAAIKAKWDATLALVDANPGGLNEPPVQKTVKTIYPHTTLAVGPDGRGNQYSAGGGEIDFRRVKFVVHAASHEAVSEIGSLIDATFASRTRDEEPPPEALDIENADWMRTEPIPEAGGGKIERGEKANGVQTWKATLEYRIWTSRPKSS